MSDFQIGFAPEEIRTDAPTREAPLKWVIVVNGDVPPGRIVNGAACVAAATGPAIPGLIGRGGVDADGSPHEGLPWAGCSIVSADTEKLRRIRDKAAARSDVFLSDMPLSAQETRVYDYYLETISAKSSDQIGYVAISLVGVRKRIDRLVGGLPLWDGSADRNHAGDGQAGPVSDHAVR